MDDDGATGYTTIQDAIAAAAAGDWICVEDGTYFGPVAVDKGVNLRSLGGSFANANAVINGAGSGRSVVITADSARLEGFIVTGGLAPTGEPGGCVLIDGADNVVVSNTEVRNCATDASGAGLAVRDSNTALLAGMYVHDNTASLNGGGVFITGLSADALITESNLANNRADRGGCLAAEDAVAPRVVDATMSGCAATTRGGAVWLLRSQGARLESVTFTSNTAPTGGALAVEAGNGSVVQGNTFALNTAVTTGGAVYDENGVDAEYSGNQFDSNVTSPSVDTDPTYGGAAVITGATGLSLVDNVFVANEAKGDGSGGAVWIDTSPAAALDANEFTSNIGWTAGGAIWVVGPDVAIRNSTFTGNLGIIYGGAVYASEADRLTAELNAFNQNDAYLYGGAIYVRNSASPTITGNGFDANSAHFNDGTNFFGIGGAVALVTVPGGGAQTASAVVSNNTFTNNQALLAGGAIYLEDADQSELVDNRLELNDAEFGGAVYAGGSYDQNTGLLVSGIDDFVSSGNTYLTNAALLDVGMTGNAWGGGVLLDLEGATPAAFADDVFTTNSALTNGGGIYCVGAAAITVSTFTVANVTFSGNTPNDVFCATGCDSSACP
ncbi:MAG: NosD domain-containing protein [Myxococcota bacterium]